MAKKRYKRITYQQRLVIEKLYNRQGYSAKMVSDVIGVHFTTIYNELRRGATERGYSAEVAQKKL